jgi:hypothetical protein
MARLVPRSRAIRVLATIVVAAFVALYGAVLYGKKVINRGARWVGFSFEDGVALVYVCAPSSRIRRAYFYLWPFKRVELEKMTTGA